MKGSPRPRRSLRLGILIAGQLVEERRADPASPITFGQSARCDLSVPFDGLPHEHVLFAPQGGRLVLRIPPGATAHLPTGLADHGTVALGRNARGKVTFGDVTILFQEVAAAPPMQLPPELRRTLADRVDRRVALFVGGSLAVHLAFAIVAWTDDSAGQPLGTPAVATTYQQDVIDVIVPDDPAITAAPTSEPGAATPATPTQTPRRIVEPTRITTRPAPPVDSQRLASILTGTDGEVGKSGMQPRQPGADLDKQIDDARDSQATIGDGTHTSRTDDRAHALDRDTQITSTDPTLTHVPGTRRDEPTGRVVPGPVIYDTWTTLTPATVLDRITHVYMAGLQRCYRLGLAADSTLSGRVAISFTVDERGHVSDADASGVSSEVDSCIAKQMQSWRFPAPREKDGSATDATFSVSLALQPS
jgi:outer membrane biosynthesis protein TonB